jgi:type IV secretory pathway VirB4 component
MPPLASLLWWDALANPRTMMLKDSALLACLRYRGPDLHSALDSALVVQGHALNNIIMRFEAGWGLLSEQRRRGVCAYPPTPWTHPVARLVDQERGERFRTPGNHYLNTTTLTLTYKPHGTSSLAPSLRHLFYTNLPATRDTAHVARFEEEVRRARGLLQECAEEVGWLEEEALLTYLHSTVSWKDQLVAVPDPAYYLDTYLTDTDLDRAMVLPSLVRWPKLGNQYIRCVSVKAFPSSTHPGMLDVLDTLPIEYRACTRGLQMDRQKAVREAQKYGDSHYGKRHRHGGSTGRVEQIAMDYSKQATAFQAGIEHGRFSAGHLTQTVVVWDEDFDKATEKAELVETTLNHAKYLAKVETWNTLSAWLGTLPGERQKNARKTPATSTNMAHLFPATGHSRGPTWNTHLHGLPLLLTTGRGQTPFWLDLHDDDVAHTMIIGPTGTGKSYLLALLALQWLKYANGGAQVYAFDKDQSLRCATLAVGGQWFDLGEEIKRTQAQGVHLDDASSKPWGALWEPEPGWWQCYETAELLGTPGIIPLVVTPLLRAIEDRLTGAPTLIILDEAWVYLKSEFFAGKIQDWLLTLRKKNAVVIFSTQNLEHIVLSQIGSDVFQSCVTKIFLANDDAITPRIGQLYTDIGLNDRQRQIVAHLAKKRQYYYMGVHGTCVFEPGAGPITLAFAGSGRKDDLAAMARLYQGDGQAFASAWLRHKSLDAAAAQLEAWYAEAAEAA